MTREEMLEDYNWCCAFEYARNPARSEGADCSVEPILIAEVEEIIGSDEGENDSASWIIVGRVKDGRYFYLEAGCDYTGWDCQAGGSCWVSNDLGNLIQFGVGEDECARLKLGDHA